MYKIQTRLEEEGTWYDVIDVEKSYRTVHKTIKLFDSTEAAEKYSKELKGDIKEYRVVEHVE